MNILIIFVLLFTFTLKAKGTNENNTDTADNYNSSLQNNSYSKNISNEVTPDKTGLNNGSNGTLNCLALNACLTAVPNTTFHKKKEGENFTQLTNTTSDDHPKVHNTSECENEADREEKKENKMPSTCKNAQNDIMKLDLRTILIFLLGVICSTIIFSTVSCFVVICSRCRTTDAKEKESIILEAVKSERDQSMMQSDEDQADEQAPLQVQTPVEVSTNTSALNSGKILGMEQTEGAGEVNEVNYASINYSLLQKKADGDLNPQKVESDYAEIQLKKLSEGEEVETLQDGEKQDGVKQDGMKQHGVKQDRVDQDGVKQDGVDQGLEGGMESQKQMELEEVQV